MCLSGPPAEPAAGAAPPDELAAGAAPPDELAAGAAPPGILRARRDGTTTRLPCKAVEVEQALSLYSWWNVFFTNKKHPRIREQRDAASTSIAMAHATARGMAAKLKHRMRAQRCHPPAVCRGHWQRASPQASAKTSPGGRLEPSRLPTARREGQSGASDAERGRHVRRRIIRSSDEG